MLTRFISQLISTCWINLKSLPKRWTTSLVAIFGVACVVSVLIGMLSMSAGFNKTMQSAGSDDTALVMRNGATSEMSSGLSYEQAELISHLSGIAKDGDEPLTSAELLVIVSVPKKDKKVSANLSLRGVLPQAFKIRDKFKIIEGRNFQTGTRELIVGRGTLKQFDQVGVGSVLKFGQSEWKVVGIFETGGSLAESELWCDAKELQGAYRRGNSFQSVRAKLESKNALAQVKTALADDPKLNLDVKLEREYLADQSKILTALIEVIGKAIAYLMAVGAVFGAVNTMYSSVAARTREIATLRAIGFGALPIAISTLVESLVLALVGGVVGSIVVYFIFNGYTVSTLNFQSFSQVVFDFAVTPELLKKGVSFAIVIGFIGGLFPAIRAARLPVAEALRD